MLCFGTMAQAQHDTIRVRFTGYDIRDSQISSWEPMGI